MAPANSDTYVYELKQLIRESYALINEIPQETHIDATQIAALRECTEAMIMLGSILLPGHEKIEELCKRAEILLAYTPDEERQKRFRC